LHANPAFLTCLSGGYLLNPGLSWISSARLPAV
jgi:hypothetical protein